MKNHLLSSAFFIILLIFTVSCGLDFKRGNGDLVSEPIEIGDFDKIYIGGNYDLTLIRSEEAKVIIHTDENLIPYINVELIDRGLNINNVHHLKASKGIFIEVFYKDIKKIYSTGASEISHEGVLHTPELDISLSGAGAIELEAETAKTNINLSGAGVVQLKGETDMLQGHISGAGGLLASDFISKDCDITLSGLGGAEVFVTEKLKATISGVGGIEYGGNPKIIEKQITGFGKINRATDIYDQENN